LKTRYSIKESTNSKDQSHRPLAGGPFKDRAIS